jgi:hypothetical protein
MIEICDKFWPPPRADTTGAEDALIGEYLVTINGQFPPLPHRRQVMMESIPVQDPYILHQFWTFMGQYMSMSKGDFIAYWTHLLSLGDD